MKYEIKLSDILRAVRKAIPKPTKAHKRVNRQSRQSVKKELKRWNG